MTEPPQSIDLYIEAVYERRLPGPDSLVCCYQKRTVTPISVYANKKLRQVRMRLHFPNEVGIRIRAEGIPDKYYTATSAIADQNRSPSVFVDLIAEATAKRHIVCLALEFAPNLSTGREHLKAMLAVHRAMPPPSRAHASPIHYVMEANAPL